jgi:rhodanese-related sulfurtransferase
MRTLFFCLLLSLTQWAGASFAGSPPASGIPISTEAIEKRPLPSPSTQSTDLYVSPETVLSLLKKKQDLTLIDVRDTNSFGRFRIPGSIHVPLYAVKAKGFLQNRFLVLVHEGYPDAQVEQACQALRDSGFKKVWILRGGLVSWSMHRGPAEGDPPARAELGKVPSPAFFLKKDSEEWLVVDISRDHKRTLRSLPRAVHVPFPAEPRSFPSRLKAALDSKPGSSPRFLLLCAAKEEDYAAVNPLVQEAGIKDAFYLKGGLAGYESFLQQLSFLAHPERITQQGGLRCFDCP